MTEDGQSSKPITPDEMQAKLLGISALDAFKLLDKDAHGLKGWRHFGEALLDLNAMELREFEVEQPSMAIYNKWLAKNPDGRVQELVAALEEIDRDDIAKGLREAILKSKAFKKLAQGNTPKASSAYDRSLSCPSKQPTTSVASMCAATKQQSLDETQLAANRTHSVECEGATMEETLACHSGNKERVGLHYATTVPVMESVGHLTGCVNAQEQVRFSDSHNGSSTPQPVISLQEVYNAVSHLLPLQQHQLELKCEVYAAGTGALIATSTPPGGCVLRDITISPELYPAPNPRVTVGTAIDLCITASQPCYLYIINIGTSGKETLLLPNASMQTFRITGRHVVRNMTIGGPTGQEVIKVLATSKDLASSDKFPVMRDIKMAEQHSTFWTSMLWGTAKVTLTIVTPYEGVTGVWA